MSKCINCNMPNQYNDMIGEYTMKKVVKNGFVKCDEKCKTYICNFCKTTQYKKNDIFVLGHNPECKSECLYCKEKLFFGKTILQCDNDCGTFFCHNCNGMLYADEYNYINKGHSPTCGDF